MPEAVVFKALSKEAIRTIVRMQVEDIVLVRLTFSAPAFDADRGRRAHDRTARGAGRARGWGVGRLVVRGLAALTGTAAGRELGEG